jgi:phosphatidylserine decarboxylase
MSLPASARLVAPFIARYGVAASEFQVPPEAFTSFNEFFIRRLRPDARPICADPNAIVFPADARHLGFADAGATGSFYAKGQWLDIPGLLRDAELARRYERAAIIISRLCPLDYHRFHFPCAGRAGEARLINGPLSSVSPIALRRSLAALSENKRVVTLVESPACGRVAIVEIGATCVGSIVHTSLPGPVRRGDEKGYFQFGGSCVITLFEPKRVQLAGDLLAHSAAGRELYAHVGDRAGTVSPE